MSNNRLLTTVQKAIEKAARGLTVMRPVLDDPRLPPIIARTDVEKFLGGIVSPETIRKDEAAGQGPRFAVTVNGKWAYYTPLLLEYVERKRVAHVRDDSLRP